MKFIVILLQMFMILNCLLANAQVSSTDPSQSDENALSPRFVALGREASFVCGNFLPNQIEGITELMPLCGGRYGMRLSPKTFLEPQILAGAARAQRYILGSVSFRTDVQFDDLIGSIYAGGDIHYATSPIFDVDPPSETTKLYFGAHVGGAIWAELADNLFFRTDLQFGLNPGTWLFIGFSFVLRFSPGGGQDNASPPSP